MMNDVPATPRRQGVLLTKRAPRDPSMLAYGQTQISASGTLGAIREHAVEVFADIVAERERIMLEAALYGWREDGTRQSEREWLFSALQRYNEDQVRYIPDFDVADENKQFDDIYDRKEMLERSISQFEERRDSASVISWLRSVVEAGRIPAMREQLEQANKELGYFMGAHGVYGDPYSYGNRYAEPVRFITEQYGIAKRCFQDIDSFCREAGEEACRQREVVFGYHEYPGDHSLGFLNEARVVVGRTIGRPQSRDEHTLPHGLTW